jgi:hypothetical protein
MNPQQSKAATKATLGLGALCTIAALAYATGGASSLLKAGHLAIWSLLPYAVLLVSTALAGTRGRALAAFIVSVLVSGYGLFIYSDALFVHLSSTDSYFFSSLSTSLSQPSSSYSFCFSHVIPMSTATPNPY